MNNSFGRLVDGMCATLRAEVLPRVDDEYARSQVWGVINALNTFKVRADWSAGFLLQQIEAQRQALAAAAQALAAVPGAPAVAVPAAPAAAPVAGLLQLRDQGNHAIGALMVWRAGHPSALPAAEGERLDAALRAALRAEVDLELRHSPRPLFAQMSGAADE